MLSEAHVIERSAPAGAPFWKYNLIDMERGLEVEVGVPVAAAVTVDDQVLAGVLPPGRYATLRHTGHPVEPDMSKWTTQLAFRLADR